ncbi:hypothetical protein [Thalassolituus alkanivorans]|uniref:hypothetical protein n=1 Tax=Thalassolituus alkanivorans TaxID=2881055 RepID=UPI001E31DF7E|nr:hypothetical protein [Thalassolituus alkanivorans]MCB2386468.1 hypothetical protein [Thalassolituus alkanivorans]MCB2424384.1 hypothetical protein [Thalassolituus alkanivorans]
MSTNLPFCVPIAAMGMPMTAAAPGQPTSGYDAVMNCLDGGDEVHDWVLNYSGIQQLVAAMPAHIPNQNDNGDYFFESTVDDIHISIQSYTTLNEEAISGQSVPDQYLHNGQTYNIIGSIEHTIAFNNVTGWSVTLPVMLLGSVPMSILGKVGYSAFLKPLAQRLYTGIRKALTTTVEEGMDETAVAAAADAAAEAADVTELILEESAIDASLSLETGGLAMIGFVGLIAIQVGIILIVHSSYHQLIIYNFTPYDLKWGDASLKHDAMITMQPVTDTTGDTPAQCLPAMSATSPSRFIAPVNTASMGQFNVYSDSETHGCKWGLSFRLCEAGTDNELTAPVGAMWDIPFSGKNSLGVSSGISQSDLSDWVKSEEGEHRHHSRSIELDNNTTVTNTLDHLQGKHKMALGSDDDGYIYRSVLVFQPT